MRAREGRQVFLDCCPPEADGSECHRANRILLANSSGSHGASREPGERRASGGGLRHAGEPFAHPQEIHRCRGQQVLHMCLRQAYIPGATCVAGPDCPRNSALYAGPPCVGGYEAWLFLPSSGRLQSLVMLGRSDRDGPALYFFTEGMHRSLLGQDMQSLIVELDLHDVVVSVVYVTVGASAPPTARRD